MQITVDQLKKIIPANKSPGPLAEALNKAFDKYDINTVNRVAGFIAQCGHESVGFTILKENLNYRAESLLKVFPKYFKTLEEAQRFQRNPEKIANCVYGNRMGNGPESSGEGYKFRGRGAIQLTGKENYTKFAASVGKSIDEAIAYVETLDGAIESACWFWKTNGLNAICDSNDIIAMTKRINGGTIGLEDRKHHYQIAQAVLSGGSISHTTPIQTTKIGSVGDTVKAIQSKLGIKVDGSFGPGTEAAVKKWQVANGLTPDGIVGPNTFKKLLG